MDTAALVTAGVYYDIDAEEGFALFVAIELLLCFFTVLVFRILKAGYWEDWLPTRGRPVRVADLPEAGSAHRIRVTGTAAPGPDGVLRAPLSGEPCVWWRVTTRESGPGAGEPRQERSQKPFRLEDGTGGVVLRLGEKDVRGFAHSLRRESSPEDRPGVEVVQEEYVITEGTRIQASGWPNPDSDGGPAFPGPDVYVVTTETAVAARREAVQGPFPWVFFGGILHLAVIAILVDIGSSL